MISWNFKQLIFRNISDTARGGIREKRTAQASIYELFAVRELGQELRRIPAWLDAHPGVLTPVLAETGLKPTGQRGLSAESVLRCALLKQHRQLSYAELAFHLQDSSSCQAFARLPLHWCPKKIVRTNWISRGDRIHTSDSVLGRTYASVRRWLVLSCASLTKSS